MNKIKGKITIVPTTQIKGNIKSSMMFPGLEDLIVKSSMEIQHFKSKAYGYNNVTVEPVVELQGDTLDIIPSTSEQKIVPTSPKNGFTEVTVQPVSSEIDSNIIPENIKKGVEVLGVTGELEGNFEVETDILTTKHIYYSSTTSSSVTLQGTEGGLLYAVIGSTKEVSSVSNGWKLLYKDYTYRDSSTSICRHTAVYVKVASSMVSAITISFSESATANVMMFCTNSLMPLYEVRTIKNTSSTSRNMSTGELYKNDIIICQETKVAFDFGEENDGYWSTNMSADEYLVNSSESMAKKMTVYRSKDYHSDAEVLGSLAKQGKIVTVMRFHTLENTKEDINKVIKQLISV